MWWNFASDRSDQFRLRNAMAAHAARVAGLHVPLGSAYPSSW